MPPRYFIGISLPKDISNQISSVQYNYYSDKIVMKPLLPHITIMHPSALQTISPLWLLPKLHDLQSEILPINIKIVGFGTFHDSNLHFKVECDDLSKIYDYIKALLPEEVIKTQFIGKRPFTPHVTIAQSKPKNKLDDQHQENYRNDLKNIIGNSFVINHLSKFDHTAPRQYKEKIIN